MRRRLALLVVAGLGSSLLAVPALAGPALAGSAAPSFAGSTVQTGQAAGEPRPVVDATATPPAIYVVAPVAPTPFQQTTKVWASTNDGQTFSARGATNQGGGDSDLAVDADHAVYALDLLDTSGASTIPVSVSTNGGRSFVLRSKAAPGDAQDSASLGHDRPWIAAWGHGDVVVSSVNTSTGNIDAWVSTDGARQFHGPITLAKDVGEQGPLVVGPGSTLWTAYVTADNVPSLHYAKSTDGGSHWITGPVAVNQTTALFPVIAVDRAGNAYVAWSGTDPRTGELEVIEFSSTTTGGATWTPPTPISGTWTDFLGDNPPAVFPWVVADQPGHIAVSYAIARQAGLNPPTSDFGGSGTTWDLVVAQSGNATRAQPWWTRVTVVADFHTGSICTEGTTCVGPQAVGIGNIPAPFDRRDLDFQGAALDGAGRVVVAYAHDRPLLSGNLGDLIFSDIDLHLARQIGGPPT